MRGKWVVGIYILLIFVMVLLFSSFKKIEISIGKQTFQYWTRAKTVEDVINGSFLRINTNGYNAGDFFKIDKIILSPLDKISPNKSTLITDGLCITLTQVKEEVITLIEEIPFKVERKEDPDLLLGENKLVSKGKIGLVKKTYVVTYYDAQEVNRELKEEKLIQTPVNEIIYTGSKEIVQRGGNIPKYKEILIIKASAYTYTGNKTATGIFPKRGTVAVDPDIIPLGTKLYIDGYGYGVAQDIGSGIKGNRIDLFMETREEALNWGLKSVRVYILE